MQEIPVVYEDENLLVVDKPAGLTVNDSETSREETLERWLRERGNTNVDRAGIVHRLDKDTSGLLVVAKDTDTMAALQTQFKERVVKKEYLALVHGVIKEPTGITNASLGRNPKNRVKFAVVEQGREAETVWQVESYYSLPQDKIQNLLTNLNKNQLRYYLAQNQQYTFVRVFPKTGRTHQIRVHFAALRHPLVSDTVYTGRKVTRLDLCWCPRQFLHAEKLSFLHPKTGERLSFVANLPTDLATALQTLSH